MVDRHDLFNRPNEQVVPMLELAIDLLASGHNALGVISEAYGRMIDGVRLTRAEAGHVARCADAYRYIIRELEMVECRHRDGDHKLQCMLRLLDRSKSKLLPGIKHLHGR